MDYIVFFYGDEEIVSLTADDVLFGEYADFKENDWKPLQDEIINVKAIFNDELYEACIIAAATTSCTELVEKLHLFQSRKKINLAKLILSLIHI